MTTLLIENEQETTPQNSLLDCLYCQELYCNDDVDDDNSSSFDEEEENKFLSLISKEEKTQISELALECNKFFVVKVRKEMLEWIKRVSSYHNLCVSSIALAVNYFDRFILSIGFQRERPWMTQLAAIASLSLASKFEEIHAPLLIQLQVDCKYIFEAKTIKRMELLILSTLEWKMNAVTPLSYFGHLVRIFKLKNHLHWEILSHWETLILSAIADPRFLHYPPSVLAIATMVQTLKELGLWKTQHQIYLMDTFKHGEDKLEECYKFIQEISSTGKTNKRKCCSSGENSPTRVLDIDLSETSRESSKKCRTSQSYC